MTLGHVPETLDQEVEKIKQKYEPLLKDSVNTIGGIGQSICDTADEKGVAYSSGYIVTEVVTALLADKGLDKLKNVAKTGKTADNVADIAEGAGKAAENAAEDAAKAGKELEGAAKGAESAAEDAGKAGKTAGKVGESGSTSKYLEQLDNLSENKINHMIDGSKNSNHGWEKLVPDKNWSDIKNIIADVMDTGVEGPYKSVFSKKATINGFEVEVTYTKLSDGTIKISDAWVNQ